MWPPFVDTSGFSLGDTFGLSLFPQIRLELCKYPEHIHEGFTGCAGGFYRLLGGFQRSAPRLHRPDDILQIADAAGQAVDAGDNENIPFAEKVQDSLQFSAASRRCAASLL